MDNIEIKIDYDYEKLVKFFIDKGLEFDAEDVVPTDIVKSFSAFEGEKLVGAIVLAKRENEFIIDGIAVEEKFRKMSLGTLLLELAEKEVINENIFLVARAPKFFRKNNYTEVNREDAPNFFECFSCPQYNETCFPKVMTKKILPEVNCHNCGSEEVI